MAKSPTTLSHGDILQHAEWVRHLARALVRDAHDADDLAQATWQASLARPPREPGPLRPWLAGVAKNLARMRARAQGRRARREELVAAEAPEAAPSAEELVARVEMQQAVARRVLALREPFRSTLLLRYYEGCSAAEIARRQQVPAGTVRWRLKQGLDELRRQLDDDHGGDRKRWALLLAPLPGALAPAPVAGGAGGAQILGVIAMKTVYKLGLVLLVALIALLVVVVGAGHRDRSETGAALGSGPAAPSGPVVAAKVAPPAPRGERDPVVREDDPVGALRLEGQVIDADDKPVGGAVVAIDTSPPRTATTAADGAFAFTGLIGRAYKLEARAGDGYAGPAQLRLAEDTEPVVLRLRPGASIAVEVRDADTSKPIEGAAVELRSMLTWHETTAADGVARLRGVGGSGFDMAIAVTARGYAPALRRVIAGGSAGDERREVMVLHRGAAVSGRALTADGKPIADARVLAVSTAEPFPLAEARRDGVVTDKDGAWAVAAIAAGSYRFVLAHPDFEPATTAPVVVDGATARTGIEIRAAAAGEVRGVVTSAAGAPVAAAEVRAIASGNAMWRTARSAYTGADGSYVLRGLPRRRAQVVATHATGASELVDVDLGAAGKAVANLRLGIDGAIDGVVVTAAGEPVAEAQIVAEPAWTGDADERERWVVRGDQYRIADSGGRFHLGGLPSGNYRVRAARAGTPEAMLWSQVGQVVATGTRGLRLAVAAPGSIEGRVLYDDGTPPPAFTVAVGYGAPAPFAGGDGRFSIEAIGGTLNVAIAGPTFLRKLVAVDVADGATKDLGTVTVTRGRSLSGRVLDPSGGPVAGATVAAGLLLTGDGAKLYIEDESIGARQTATDDQGRWLLSGFPPASITVVAGKEGVGRSAAVPIASGSASAEVDLVLAATGAVSGIARLDGAPLADTIVIASPANGSSANFFVTTGPDGSFAFDNLTPDRYAITPIVGDRGDKYFRRVDVVAGGRPQLDIDAATGTGAVDVAVKTDAGAVVGAAKVAVVGVAVDATAAPNLAALRYGALFPALPAEGPPVAFVMRNAIAGAAHVDHLRAGAYTACAVPLPGDPKDPVVAQQLKERVNTLPMRCLPVTIDGAGSKALTITVPAAWTKA